MPVRLSRLCLVMLSRRVITLTPHHGNATSRPLIRGSTLSDPRRPPPELVLVEQGVRILRTPMQAPKANCSYRRLAGTIQRECLAFLPRRARGVGGRDGSRITSRTGLI